METSKEVAAGKREHAEWISYNELDKLCKEEKWSEYGDLPAQTAQQILKILDKNWKSFFRAVKEWKVNPSKFKGRPKLPKYKHKIKGRNIVIFTSQQIKKKGNFLYFPKKSFLSPLKSKVESGLRQIRIIPKSTCYVIEVVYNKEIILQKRPNEFKYLSIDLGVNNICAVISNDITIRPLILNGRPLKSINQYYNKQKAKLMSYVGDKGTSNRIEKLTHKHNQKINDFMHKTSKMIVSHAVKHNVGRIIIGKNDGWKQEVNIGKRNNQNFVQIPFDKLIEQIEYKSEEFGISVDRQEESYTSKIDHLAKESMMHHAKYLGKRIKRGLFKSSTGRVLNADINGALGILLKAVSNVLTDGIEALGLTPLKVTPL